MLLVDDDSFIMILGFLRRHQLALELEDCSRHIGRLITRYFNEKGPLHIVRKWNNITSTGYRYLIIRANEEVDKDPLVVELLERAPENNYVVVVCCPLTEVPTWVRLENDISFRVNVYESATVTLSLADMVVDFLALHCAPANNVLFYGVPAIDCGQAFFDRLLSKLGFGVKSRSLYIRLTCPAAVKAQACGGDKHAKAEWDRFAEENLPSYMDLLVRKELLAVDNVCEQIATKKNALDAFKRRYSLPLEQHFGPSVDALAEWMFIDSGKHLCMDDPFGFMSETTKLFVEEVVRRYRHIGRPGDWWTGWGNTANIECSCLSSATADPIFFPAQLDNFENKQRICATGLASSRAWCNYKIGDCSEDDRKAHLEIYLGRDSHFARCSSPHQQTTALQLPTSSNPVKCDNNKFQVGNDAGDDDGDYSLNKVYSIYRSRWNNITVETSSTDAFFSFCIDGRLKLRTQQPISEEWDVYESWQHRKSDAATTVTKWLITRPLTIISRTREEVMGLVRRGIRRMRPIKH